MATKRLLSDVLLINNFMPVDNNNLEVPLMIDALLQTLTESQTFTRGKALYEASKIRIEQQRDGKAVARVMGTKDYSVVARKRANLLLVLNPIDADVYLVIARLCYARLRWSSNDWGLLY